MSCFTPNYAFWNSQCTFYKSSTTSAPPVIIFFTFLILLKLWAHYLARNNVFLHVFPSTSLHLTSPKIDIIIASQHQLKESDIQKKYSMLIFLQIFLIMTFTIIELIVFCSLFGATLIQTVIVTTQWENQTEWLNTGLSFPVVYTDWLFTPTHRINLYLKHHGFIKYLNNLLLNSNTTKLLNSLL